MDLEHLPSVSTARLPDNYVTAKQALATCDRIDECADWADKAAAMASYAKQSDDDELEKYSRRIRARAIRRCGELLKQYQAHEEGKPGRPKQNGMGRDTISQRRAAATVGWDKNREADAVRIANIPEDEFEAAVESEDPPTITALAEMGTKKRVELTPMEGRDPADFKVATRLLGALESWSQEAPEIDMTAAIRGMLEWERNKALALIYAIGELLNKMARTIEEYHD